jgi:hypothetical protein
MYKARSREQFYLLTKQLLILSYGRCNFDSLIHCNLMKALRNIHSYCTANEGTIYVTARPHYFQYRVIVSPNFHIHVSACGRYIYFQDWFALLLPNRQWEYINRFQIHECRNWERGRAVSFPGIHKSDFRYSVACIFKDQ